MKVLAWVPQAKDTSPGQRFRLEQWEPHLKREGIEITWSPFSNQALVAVLQRNGAIAAKAVHVLRALARRLREAFRARDYDLVYVFRETALFGPALAERILRLAGVPYVVDFDDAIWVRYVSPSNHYFSYLRFPGKTRALVRGAQRVLAGNTYLREWALRYNPHVDIVPTTIDTDVYRPLPRRQNPVPVIGWTGSFSTEQYLDVVKPALVRLSQRQAFRLVVVGGGAFRATGVEVEHRPWRSATEVADLADFDLGLMPLPDAEWERGKCALKALQYMALGVPPVVSPVGVNAEVVRHGVDGLLARDTAEWESALDRLLTDASLRERMGRSGRERVEAGFSAAIHAPRVAEAFREAVR